MVISAHIENVYNTEPTLNPLYTNCITPYLSLLDNTLIHIIPDILFGSHVIGLGTGFQN